MAARVIGRSTVWLVAAVALMSACSSPDTLSPVASTDAAGRFHCDGDLDLLGGWVLMRGDDFYWTHTAAPSEPPEFPEGFPLLGFDTLGVQFQTGGELIGSGEVRYTRPDPPLCGRVADGRVILPGHEDF